LGLINKANRGDGKKKAEKAVGYLLCGFFPENVLIIPVFLNRSLLFSKWLF
jgi:hypothetical protein